MNEYKKNKNKNFKVFLFLLILFIMVFFLFFQTFRIKTIQVEGSKHYTEDEITKKIIKNQLGKCSITLYIKNKYFEQEKIPFIETVDVVVVNRNTVKLEVYEKSIIGCIEFMNEYMYFDKDGIIVETSVEKLDDVPCVTGLSFQNIVLHEKLVTSNESLFQTILNLTQLIKKYEINVEKINFNLRDEVTLYADEIRIILGKFESYDEQIAELKNILPKAEGLKGCFDMTNFKDGQDKIIFNKDTK